MPDLPDFLPLKTSCFPHFPIISQSFPACLTSQGPPGRQPSSRHRPPTATQHSSGGVRKCKPAMSAVRCQKAPMAVGASSQVCYHDPRLGLEVHQRARCRGGAIQQRKTDELCSLRGRFPLLPCPPHRCDEASVSLTRARSGGEWRTYR